MEPGNDNLSLLKQLTDRLLESERATAKVTSEFGKESRICEQTFDAIPDAIFITNTALVILKCNAAFAELVNLPQKSIVGKRCFDIFECDKSNYCEGGKCIAQQLTESNFKPIVKQSYSTKLAKWLDVRISFANHDINGFIHILRDITTKFKDSTNG